MNTLGASVYAVVDSGEAIQECIEDNNTAEAAIVSASVFDFSGLEDRQYFSVSVQNSNTAPTITSNPILTGSETQTYNYDVEVSDADIGDDFSFTLMSLLRVW